MKRHIGKLALILLTPAAVVFMAGVSQAATAGSQLNVSASVATDCTVSAAPISFGAYTGVQVDASGELTVTCTTGTVYRAALDAGQNYAAGYYERRMSNGAGAYLNYLVYGPLGGYWGDAGYGDTHPGGVYTGTGDGNPQILTVNGSINQGQSGSPAGAYGDVVNVTVWY